MTSTEALKISKDELLDLCTDEELQKIDEIFKSYDLFYYEWNLDANHHSLFDKEKKNLTVSDFLDDYKKEFFDYLENNFDVNYTFDKNILENRENIKESYLKILNPKVNFLNNNLLLIKEDEKETYLGHKDDLISFFKENGGFIEKTIIDKISNNNDVVSITNTKMSEIYGVQGFMVNTKEETAILVCAINSAIFQGKLEEKEKIKKQKLNEEEL